MIDRSSDLHTHSTITDGTAGPRQMGEAALATGLTTWGLSDHVRASTSWLDDYVRVVRSLRCGDLQIRCGVEAKILDVSGRLDLPAQLPALDYILIADHQFPGVDGPLHPDEIRQRVRNGKLNASAVVELLVRATAAAVTSAPLPAIVVHPFSLLPKCGLSEDLVTEELLDELAAACRAVDAQVEVNEKWRCPTARIVAGLEDRGVSLCAGSDAHRLEDVGAWLRPGSPSYLDEVDRREVAEVHLTP